VSNLHNAVPTWAYKKEFVVLVLQTFASFRTLLRNKGIESVTQVMQSVALSYTLF